MLCDLTSSYVEGTHGELARHGYSRDGKKGTLQIVLGLLCTATGCPVAVEVFEGTTSVAKHFVTTITDESFTFRRDEAGIADEQQLDGLYIVRSNVESEQFDTAQTVRAGGPPGCKRISCCACPPTTSSGTCAKPSLRSSSTTTTRPRPNGSAHSWPGRPSARPRRTGLLIYDPDPDEVPEDVAPLANRWRLSPPRSSCAT